ncbi:MAG: hypothetical protein WAJ88_17585 [Pseudolabrys sp.]
MASKRRCRTAVCFTQHPPDNEQRFDQDGQIGVVPDQLLDARLEPGRPDHSDLEAEVTQSPAQVVLDGNGLRLQQLAMGQQHAQLLTCAPFSRPQTVLI